MFTNIGKKIKILAVIYAVLGFIASTISGMITMFTTMAQAIDYEEPGLLFLGLIMGLLIIVGGCLVAWITSWPLYGFGELIDKTADTAYNTAILAEKAFGTDDTAL